MKKLTAIRSSMIYFVPDDLWSTSSVPGVIFPVSWLAAGGLHLSITSSRYFRVGYPYRIGSCYQSPAWIISHNFSLAYAGVHKQETTNNLSGLSRVQWAPQGRGAFADGEHQITFKQQFQGVRKIIFSIPKDVDIGAITLAHSGIYEESSTSRPSSGDKEGTIVVTATCVETQTLFGLFASRNPFTRNSRMKYRMSNDLSRTCWLKLKNNEMQYITCALYASINIVGLKDKHQRAVSLMWYDAGGASTPVCKQGWRQLLRPTFFLF